MHIYLTRVFGQFTLYATYMHASARMCYLDTVVKHVSVSFITIANYGK